MLLVQGTADTTVFPARTHDLLARLCSVGQVVRYDEIPGADHGNVFTMDLANIESWLADRMAGLPAPDSCDDLPTTTTTLAPASTTSLPATTTPQSGVQPASSLASTPPPTTGELPPTGSPLAPVALGGLGLAAIGVILLARTRRRVS